MLPAVVAEGPAWTAGSGAWRLWRTKRAENCCCVGYPYCLTARGRAVLNEMHGERKRGRGKGAGRKEGNCKPSSMHLARSFVLQTRLRHEATARLASRWSFILARLASDNLSWYVCYLRQSVMLLEKVATALSCLSSVCITSAYSSWENLL